MFRIHEFLHDNRVGSDMTVTIDGQVVRMEIMKDTQGLRYMIYRGTTFTEQNRRVNTVFGHLAKSHTITWGPKRRIKIVDNKIYYDNIKLAEK